MGSGEAWGALEKPFQMGMSHRPLNHWDTDEDCLFVSSPPFLLIKLAFLGEKQVLALLRDVTGLQLLVKKQAVLPYVPIAEYLLPEMEDPLRWDVKRWSNSARGERKAKSREEAYPNFGWEMGLCICVSESTNLLIRLAVPLQLHHSLLICCMLLREMGRCTSPFQCLYFVLIYDIFFGNNFISTV